MSDLRGIYEKIMMDEEWYDWMGKISEISESGKIQKMYSDHSMGHATRVAEYAMNFVNECHSYEPFDGLMAVFGSFGREEDVYLSGIAALLHDIGLVNAQHNHAVYSQVMTKKYLKKYRMTYREVMIILEAIGSHGGEGKIDNIVDAAVMMGDKLDITRGRILAYYDEALMPLISPVQKELLKVRRTNFFLDDEYSHGVLKWDLIASEMKDFDTEVQEMLTIVTEEWPKCITVPKRVTEEFLGMEFALVVDDAESLSHLKGGVL